MLGFGLCLSWLAALKARGRGRTRIRPAFVPYTLSGKVTALFTRQRSCRDRRCSSAETAHVLPLDSTRLTLPGMRDEANDTMKNRDRLRRLRGLLAGKADERNKVVGLYRRGRLNDAELDQQVEEIDKDAAGLAAQIEELEGKLAGTDSNGAVLEGAEALLTRLRKRLDQPVTFERKRQLVELLVGGIRIETIRNGAQRENVVTVTYRFPSAVEACTDTDSSPPPA